MIEKVARAMATAQWKLIGDEGFNPTDAYDLTNNNGRFLFDEMARAAIEAMREPSDEMQTAALAKIGYEVDWVGGLMGSSYSAGVQVFTDAYTAMIDAALSEEKAE